VTVDAEAFHRGDGIVSVRTAVLDLRPHVGSSDRKSAVSKVPTRSDVLVTAHPFPRLG